MSDSPPEPAIRNVSDTAIWAALYRARETEREDALFRDRFARRLAGARGDAIAAQMKGHDRHAWAWVMRTVLFDRFIAEEIAQGADMVVNLAAGLDARPYRMPLDPSFPWIEVDLPGILDDKEAACVTSGRPAPSSASGSTSRTSPPGAPSLTGSARGRRERSSSRRGCSST